MNGLHSPMKTPRSRRHHLRPGRARRGLTLVETVISIAIFSIVGVLLSYSVLVVAKNSRRSLVELPAQGHAYRTVDRIRAELLPASRASIVTTDAPYGIQFFSPRRNTTAWIFFDPSEERCYFMPDISDTGTVVDWGALEDFLVQPGGNARTIRIVAASASEHSRREGTVVRFEDTITVRN